MGVWYLVLPILPFHPSIPSTKATTPSFSPHLTYPTTNNQNLPTNPTIKPPPPTTTQPHHQTTSTNNEPILPCSLQPNTIHLLTPPYPPIPPSFKNFLQPQNHPKVAPSKTTPKSPHPKPPQSPNHTRTTPKPPTHHREVQCPSRARTSWWGGCSGNWRQACWCCEPTPSGPSPGGPDSTRSRREVGWRVFLVFWGLVLLRWVFCVGWVTVFVWA